MDEQDEHVRDPGRDSLHLDALAVSDRFRLFNFTRRDDHLAYLWVLRALDRLRAVHQVQAHSEDVAVALAELAETHEDVPAHHDLMRIRERLDALADDQILHRLEDASRAGSLARYRNRQSVYQFSELGYRAYAAVEDVLADHDGWRPGRAEVEYPRAIGPGCEPRLVTTSDAGGLSMWLLDGDQPLSSARLTS